METTYMQNRQTEEIHRLYEGQSREECNLDDARDKGSLNVIDESDALRLVAGNPNIRCGHCWPITTHNGAPPEEDIVDDNV